MFLNRGSGNAGILLFASNPKQWPQSPRGLGCVQILIAPTRSRTRSCIRPFPLGFLFSLSSRASCPWKAGKRSQELKKVGRKAWRTLGWGGFVESQGGERGRGWGGVVCVQECRRFWNGTGIFQGGGKGLAVCRSRAAGFGMQQFSTWDIIPCVWGVPKGSKGGFGTH